MDKAELAKRIREIEGLTNEERSELLALLNSRKRYGLVWEDKPEEAEEILKTHIPVLTEVKDKEINHDTETQKNPNHILIEGDNLHALTSLCYTHEGKIDVIYIDPPYNTGARNWKYNNDYVDNEDCFKHSKWISWIKKRLLIANKLLKNKGIIIATIDDYEFAQLRLIMDEIFKEENFLATVVIKNNPSGRSTVRGFSVNHEYALFYSKTEVATLGRLSHNEEQKSRYSEKDALGYYEWENFRKNGTDSDKKDRPKQFFPIIIDTHTNKLRIPLLKWNEESNEYSFPPFLSNTEKIIWPVAPDGTEKVWKYGLERTKIVLSEILVKKKLGKYELYRKKYLNSEGSLPRTWWDKPEYSARDNGTRILTNIFGPTKVFDFPKAPEAVKDALTAANLGKDGFVLDFFAGSGTTLHATMQLNAEDGGHRQCILVTNNENDICEKVTYERNKRVIEGYTTPKGVAVEGLKANNLRYFRCEMKPRELSHQSKRELVMAMTDILRIKEDIYAEQNQFGSLPLNGKARLLRYFANGDRRMLIVYDTRVLPFVIKEIGQMEGSIKIYLFADGAYPYTEDFRSVMDKVELVALPHAFSQALKHVLPQAPEEALEEPDLTEEEQAAMMEEAIEAENNEEQE